MPNACFNPVANDVATAASPTGLSRAVNTKIPTIISKIAPNSSAQLGIVWPRLRNASGSSKNRRSRFPNELGFGGRGGRTGRGVGCGRALVILAEEVLLDAVVLVAVLADVLPVPAGDFVVFVDAVDFAGVAIFDGGVLLVVVLAEPAADLPVVPVVDLLVPVALLDVFGADVREDTTEALPVVFLLVPFDGAWAAVFGVVVDFLPDAELEVELVRAGLGVSDGLRGGVFRSDMQITYPFELNYLIIVPCQPARWKKR